MTIHGVEDISLSEKVTKLQSVMDTTGFELAFQPKFRTTSGAISGVEVLVRWPGANADWHQPDYFVRLAEQQALSLTLDLQVLTQALKILNTLPAGLRLKLSPVSINVSAASVQDEAFLEAVKRVLSSTQHPKLVFELTETASLGSLTHAKYVFDTLSKYGVSLSVDDFLQGHNNLSVLQALPAVEVKIDKQDVAAIHERRGFHRVAGIIRVARERNLHVTAEGIENPGQWSLLRSMGCDYCQGFWLGPPMPISELVLFAGAHRSPMDRLYNGAISHQFGDQRAPIEQNLKLAP